MSARLTMRCAFTTTKFVSERALARALILLAFLFIHGSTATPARAEIFDEIRVSVADDKFSGTRQLAAVFQRRAPVWLRAHHTEVAVGGIQNADDSRPFLSIGPVWRWGREDQSVFVEFGFSPTVIGGSRFADRDMGGNVHFTSSLSIGHIFGRFRQAALALRPQHISNGGLSDTNPGMDMLGLNFAFNFAAQ